MKNKASKVLNLHLSNILGLGARNIIESLLVSFSNNNNNNIKILNAYFPPKSKAILNAKLDPNIDVYFFERKIPNLFSRFLEIIFWKPSNSEGFLFIFGDIPLRRVKNQILYLHSTLVIQSVAEHSFFLKVKYLILKSLFFLNINNVRLVVVQTKLMQHQLLFKYPGLNVIALPPPPNDIYIKSKYQFSFSKKRFLLNDNKLKAFYPASFYYHKNHALLKNIRSFDIPISELILTITPENNPDPSCDFIKCIGEISGKSVYEYYLDSDVLIFLSITESYGLPLVEAMALGIPIICPNLPYARELCADQAIYFNVVSPESFKHAVDELIHRLKSGWKPNYKKPLKSIILDWNLYGQKILSSIEALDPELH